MCLSVCVCVWVCVRTYLNIISQTCQVASVPAIQWDNGSLGSASVRIFCDCVWICVCVCSRGRPDNETRHVCHLLRCLFFGFCNPGWKTHLSPFRHRCLQCARMCRINTRSLHVQVHLRVHSYKHISSQTHIQTSFFDLMSMEMSQSHRCRGWSVILWQAVFPNWLVSGCWLLQREVCTKNLPVIALVTNCLLWSPVVWMEDTDLSLDNWPPWNLKKCDRNWKWRTFASKVKAVPSTQTNMFQKVELLLWRVVVCHPCKLEATTTRC